MKTSSIIATTLIGAALAAPKLDARQTQSCEVTHGPVSDHYHIVIPSDGSQTTAGYDAPGNCGGGFLDNMHGQALTVTNWGCKYIFYNAAEVDFDVELDAANQVNAAYNAATGGLNPGCSNSS